jgi:hypothetical protein
VCEVWPLLAVESKGQQNKYVNKPDFLGLKNFKLLSQIEKNTKNCDFLKFVIYFRGNHCDCRSRAQP